MPDTSLFTAAKEVMLVLGLVVVFTVALLWICKMLAIHFPFADSCPRCGREEWSYSKIGWCGGDVEEFRECRWCGKTQSRWSRI